MKKLFKALAAVAIATAATVSIAAFAGCDSSTTYEGEYKYENAWAAGSYYGVKVSVTVKDDTIQKVTIVDSDYTEVTESWSNREVWDNGIDSLLAAYEGKTVSEIKAITVVCSDSGEPVAATSDSFVSYDSDLIITGATVGSGRLLLAVQNALERL